MDARAAESLLEFAERAAPELQGLDARKWSAQLEERYPDLLAALQWFIDEVRTDEAIRLARSLYAFWMATKRLAEGSEWVDRALASAGRDDANRGRAFVQAAFLAFWQGDDDRAATLHNRALEIGRRIGDQTVAALALTGLARIALRTEDIAGARLLCHKALALTDGVADAAGRSSAVHVLGAAAQMAGDFGEARQWMTERVALAREQGTYSAFAMEASNLSMVERQLGDFARAEALAREALEITRRRDDEWMFPYILNSLAAVAMERGEFDRAARIIGAAEAMVAAQGAAWPPDERPHYERTVAKLAEAMGSDGFERVRSAGQSLTSREAVAFALAAGPAG